VEEKLEKKIEQLEKHLKTEQLVSERVRKHISIKNDNLNERTEE